VKADKVYDTALHFNELHITAEKEHKKTGRRKKKEAKPLEPWQMYANNAEA